ncbi:MAG: DUF1345 domain-containing protein [Acidimicrobiia bacterium]
MPDGVNHLQSARSRVVFALVCGAIATLVAAWFVPWQITVLVGWDVAALAVLIRVWTQIWHYDPVQTREWAMREDDTRTGAEILLLGAGVASLVGVGFVFLKAQEGGRYQEVLLEAMGIATIVISWLVVHTTFTLRYAHLYYTEPIGGIDFKTQGAEVPDYRDFAYTAFTVGMTYQVSDTDITMREMRQTVMRHALLSFVFGAVIIGATVNIVAGLLNA